MREKAVDVLVTDYTLFGSENGGWMLEHAHAEGLLAATRAVVICTASPRVEPPSVPMDVRVVKKPFDIDQLLSHVERMMRGDSAAAE